MRRGIPVGRKIITLIRHSERSPENPAKRKIIIMRLRLDLSTSLRSAQDDIKSDSGSMSGIPRAACRPALNDEVKVGLRILF